MADIRVVPCENCGTEGRIYVLDYGYDHHTGPYWGERDCGPCPCCEGTGGELIAVEPITFEDLGIGEDDLEELARQEREDNSQFGVGA